MILRAHRFAPRTPEEVAGPCVVASLTSAGFVTGRRFVVHQRDDVTLSSRRGSPSKAQSVFYDSRDTVDATTGLERRYNRGLNGRDFVVEGKVR